ncbi:DUF397 domain-containing protein [Streptomyces sp. ID05-39B]|uniref:DUF397 domain-containing protein n=1 Tax=Streptomyces sp. ID05-39B TaxID=3028664 RepID=UPI0029B5538F|nr:DUF397 domain-containing protein [Streptomyces sp. ID05-39B]MDX3531502.1 DUF397 domain-containing protein [Streptomyces sp. ID05-39B]
MTAPENWQKSSFSGGGDGNNCLELASTPTTLHLRESDTRRSFSPPPHPGWKALSRSLPRKSRIWKPNRAGSHSCLL